MQDSEDDKAAGGIERLRDALDAEERRCLTVQRQLDRANAEFEEFVSMAAHDLREPLRDVAAFSQLLAEEHGSMLDSEGIVFLDRIQSGAARMQSLLAAMVDYWATGTGDKLHSWTDMEVVIHQALLYVERQMPEKSAAVTHDALPMVSGDFGTLTKVLHHLIRNALEYCETLSPMVHVSCKRADSDWIISIKDNGPGIDPAFQSRIFLPFKRLHGKEHPGNGLGLAFCKRAIEWHGGRIWIEPVIAPGSTFCFTVAAADQPSRYLG